MSNSEQTNQDNVIFFKQRVQFQTPSLPKLKCELTQKHAQQIRSATKPSPKQHDDYTELFASKGNPTRELVDECAPSIVRRIVKHIRKRSGLNNHLPTTLPKVLERQLQLLIDFNHPAGLVLEDWLEDHRQSLPNGFEETYARASNREGASHE